MSDPNPTNRERLLRLIDGGTDALHELHADEPPVQPSKPIPVTVKKKDVSAAQLWKEWRAKVPLSGRELLVIGRWLIAAVLILACLHYGLEAMRAWKEQSKPVPVPGQEPAAQDESGIGLRLVGVDSSEPPVALLEDLKTGKTYFAKVNEHVKDARVKQIEKNKVLLSVRGKNVELR